MPIKKMPLWQRITTGVVAFGAIGTGAAGMSGVFSGGSTPAPPAPTGQHQTFTPKSPSLTPGQTSASSGKAPTDQPSASQPSTDQPTGYTVNINSTQFNNASADAIGKWIKDPANHQQYGLTIIDNASDAANLLAAVKSDIQPGTAINVTVSDAFTLQNITPTTVMVDGGLTYGNIITLNQVAGETEQPVTLSYVNGVKGTGITVVADPQSGIVASTYGSGTDVTQQQSNNIAASLNEWANAAQTNPKGFPATSEVAGVFNTENGTLTLLNKSARTSSGQQQSTGSTTPSQTPARVPAGTVDGIPMG